MNLPRITHLIPLVLSAGVGRIRRQPVMFFFQSVHLAVEVRQELVLEGIIVHLSRGGILF